MHFEIILYNEKRCTNVINYYYSIFRLGMVLEQIPEAHLLHVQMFGQQHTDLCVPDTHICRVDLLQTVYLFNGIDLLLADEVSDGCD